MTELPAAMCRGGRPKDKEFKSAEYLYRRVPPELWESKDDDIELDAIQLPDMSVIRSKYAHPEWARFDGGTYKYPDWGVVGFQVQDIPPRLPHLGVFLWTFAPRHVPLDDNYPHAEVWAFEGERHINAKAKIDPDLHLRWREQLARKLRKFIGPSEDIEVRQEPPAVS
jgi:hypothetical protein